MGKFQIIEEGYDEDKSSVRVFGRTADLTDRPGPLLEYSEAASYPIYLRIAKDAAL